MKYLTCGGIFKYEFVTNFSLTKEFLKSVNIEKSYGQEFRVCFLTHGVETVGTETLAPSGEWK